jgi:hypothetical protein
MPMPGVIALISLSLFGYRNCSDEEMIAQAKLVLNHNGMQTVKHKADTDSGLPYTRPFYDASVVENHTEIHAEVPACLESTAALFASHAHAHDADDTYHFKDQFDAAIGGQWSGACTAETKACCEACNDGLIPSLVFGSAAHPMADSVHWLNWTFMPGPGFWRTSEFSQTHTSTTGIASLPLQGAALHKLSLNMPKTSENIGFLCTAVPKILRYHEYLFRRAFLANSSLVPIIHPWESPHSELWGDTLGNSSSAPSPYTFPLRRVMRILRSQRDGFPNASTYTPSVNLSDAQWGPQQAWKRAFPAPPSPYPDPDSYEHTLLPSLALIRCLQWKNYSLSAVLDPQQGCPFQVLDVGFNSALLQSSRALSTVRVH